MSKLAFVGDEKWEDEIFMFTGKPMRRTVIEFSHEISSTRLKSGYLRKTYQPGRKPRVFLTK